MEAIQKLLTTREAAEYLGLRPSTLEIWRCTKRYPLRYRKLGRSVRYDIQDLKDFAERGTAPAATRASGGRHRRSKAR